MTNSENNTVKVKRYPNRRYYDTTHSQHVTLEAIYQLILEGHDVEVTDSKSGEDITPKVLTQIILEHETAKLEVFPVGLLHRLIRANEPLVREFVEKYFSQAFAAFAESQRQLGDYIRESMGLRGSRATNWAWGPFIPPFVSGPGRGTASTGAESGDVAGDGDVDLRQRLEELQRQVTELREELDGD